MSLPNGTNAAARRYEPGTSWLRVCGLIHWATTAPNKLWGYLHVVKKFNNLHQSTYEIVFGTWKEDCFPHVEQLAIFYTENFYKEKI